MTRVDKGDMPTGYNSLGNKIIFDNVWDETAKLLIIDDIKESSKEKIEITANRINSSKAGDDQPKKKKVEKSKTEKSEVGKG